MPEPLPPEYRFDAEHHPTDDQLAAFAFRDLTAKERRLAIEIHILTCDLCYKKLLGIMTEI